MTMDSIILLGPFGVGKSTVAKQLSEQLGWPSYSLDETLRAYLAEIGVARDRVIPPMDAVERQPWHAYAVERFLVDHVYEQCILEIGGGQDTYDGEPFAKVQQLLQPYKYVVLLIPSDDLEESIQDLIERNNRHFAKRDTDHACFNRQLITHPSSRALAKFVVHTKSTSAEETAGAILQFIRQQA
jgi:shikimate kinase